MKFNKYITLVASCIVLMFMPIFGMDTKSTERRQEFPQLAQLGLIEPATLKFQTAYSLIKQKVDIDQTDLPIELKEYAKQLRAILREFYIKPESKIIFFNFLNDQDLDFNKLFPNQAVAKKQVILDNALCDATGVYFIDPLIKLGANVNGNCAGRTMLIGAIRLYDMLKALQLLHNNADINLQTAGGDTALIWASDDPEKLEILKILLAQSPKIDRQSKNGMTALITAATHNNTEGVRLLLEAGADKTKKYLDKTALEWATERNYVPIINLLSRSNVQETYPQVEKLGVRDPTLAFRSAYTLVKEGTDIGKTNVLDELKEMVNLLKKALDPLVYTPTTRKLLLNFLNNPNYQIDMPTLFPENPDQPKQTILDEAFKEVMFSNEMTFINYLLEAGAGVNATFGKTYQEHTTPLITAVNNNNIELVDKLLKMGASLNQGDGIGQTPLMVASAKPERIAILKHLLAHSPLINAKDKYDSTALIEAAIGGNTEAVKLLIDAGADTHAKFIDGSTALEMAKDEGHEDIVSLLSTTATIEKK